MTPVPTLPAGLAVLVSEAYNVPGKTKRLYESLHRRDMADGNVTRRLIASLAGDEFPPSNLLCNSFERAAYEVFEGLDRVRQTMYRAGGREVHLSGSGPTLYALPSVAPKGEGTVERLLAEGLRHLLPNAHERE